MQGTVIGDADPQFDDCSSPKGGLLAMSGRNVGDLLNAKDITWGWFQGGFRPTESKDGKAVCGAKSTNLAGREVPDYSPHHEPFQYFQQTANPHHLPPSSVDMIGRTDQANHQYDLADFFAALGRDHLPAVSFVKAKSTRTAMPAIPTRSTSRPSWSRSSTRSRSRPTGATRRSSSPTTIPTAGTTMSCRRS